MAGNALPILLIGGAALLMMSGKKKKSSDWDYKDVPDAPTEAAGINEQAFVDIAFDGQPKNAYLGNQAVVAKVSGVDAGGFVHPLANETLANWYTRVAYWGAYPFHLGAPFEIPPQCMAPDLAKTLGIPCDPGFIPYRDALLRIYGLVVAEGKKRGMNMDARPGSQA